MDIRASRNFWIILNFQHTCFKILRAKTYFGYRNVHSVEKNLYWEEYSNLQVLLRCRTLGQPRALCARWVDREDRLEKKQKVGPPQEDQKDHRAKNILGQGNQVIKKAHQSWSQEGDPWLRGCVGPLPWENNGAIVAKVWRNLVEISYKHQS